MEKGIISRSKPKVRKVESDEEDSVCECYDRSDGKPIPVDIDKEATEGNKPTLALVPKTSEEDEINKNGETVDGDNKISLRSSN